MKIGALTGALLIDVNTLFSIQGILFYGLRIIVAGIAAIIPDLDHPSGKINQTILPSNKKYLLMLIYSMIGMVFIFYGNGFNGYLIGLFIILMGFTRHRGFTHSIVGMIWFYLILRSIFIQPATVNNFLESLLSILSVFKNPMSWQWCIVQGAFVGYVSHPGTDFLTSHGFEVWWPNKENYRIELFDKKNIGTLYTILISIGVIKVILQVV